ncbi:antitoxin Xre/MbcA/ParS toxin-binding domain-containing protein [Chitinophaga sp. XS-30]|uniref:antitoxin Xre/MbcA/ParS toxin-binding domain-containing protein n=1 Tax=Chitinophaga sp. XS-30 TaxID=2604421 RepID=UPI0011DE197C|nr:antitoxin Xre/MbcA/ParS toxin-binding domain-containing protein [Chitinophaga sp. XS-30]QEH39443.1 DUF2384 domain-containing protein [Chitinophaga sp. XS-30]
MSTISLLSSYEAILSLQSVCYSIITDQIHRGITKKQLVQFKDVLDITFSELAGLLHVTDRTLYLKNNEDVLSETLADHAFSIAQIYSIVYNAFLNKKKADRWMRLKSKAFGDKSAMELCKSIVGREAVAQEIMRLRMGLY